MSNKLLANSFISVLNNVIQLIVSLGSGFLVARILGAQGKGEVYLITQISTIVQVVFLFGLSSSLLYFIKRSEISFNQSLSFSLVYNVLLLIFFGLIIYYFPNQINRLFGGNLSQEYLFLAFLIALLNIFCSFVGYVLMSRNEGVRLWSIITIVGNIVYIIALLFFIPLFSLGVRGAILALLVSTLFKCIIFIVPVIKTGFRFERFSIRIITTVFIYGLGVFIGNLFLTSVFRLDVFFLNKHVTLEEVGLYSVAVNVSELLLLIPNALGVVLFPHLAGLEINDKLRTMSQIGRLSFILGCVGCIGLLIIGYPFIYIIFGKDFIEAFVPFLYLLPGLLAMTLNYAYSNFFSSLGKPYTVAFSFGLGLIINVVLNIIFIRTYGMYAAAIASSVTYLVITLTFIFAIKIKYKLSVRDFVFPVRSDFYYIIERSKSILKIKK